MERLLIVGSGGHARVVLDAALSTGQFEVCGFIDDNQKRGAAVEGFSILGSTDDIPDIVAAHPEARLIVAVGDNHARFLVVEKIEGKYPKVRWAKVIDRSAVISPRALISEGAMVMAGSVCNPSVQIGRHVIINNSTSLAHDSVVGEFASTGPGVTTGGNVSVGPRSHIGVGATISHGIKIGPDTVIGAGSVIVRDCPQSAVVFGVPGRVIRSRVKGERYL